MPKGEPIPDFVKQEILDLFTSFRRKGYNTMQCYEKTAMLVGRSTKVVGVVVNRMRPTTNVARTYLQSKALKLAKRLVKEAKAPEIMQLLERSSMGVIDAPAKVDTGDRGFVLAFSAETCGAVKLGVAVGGALPAAASEAPFDPYALQTGEQHEAISADTRFFGRSKDTQEAIERARIRLANVRSNKEVQGIQRLDEHTETVLEGEEIEG